MVTAVSPTTVASNSVSRIAPLTPGGSGRMLATIVFLSEHRAVLVDHPGPAVQLLGPDRAVARG